MLKLALFVSILGVFLQNAYPFKVTYFTDDFFFVCFEQEKYERSQSPKAHVDKFCHKFKNLRKDVKRCRVVDDARVDENYPYDRHISDSCGVRNDTGLHSVLLSEVKSDMICYQRRLAEKDKEMSRIFSDVGTFCGNYEYYINRLRQDVRECKVGSISFDGYEAFFKDFCGDVSGMKTTFQDNEECLLESNICTRDPNKNGGSSMNENIRIGCWKQPSIYECLRDRVGKPCGAEHLIDRFIKAVDSYYKGTCAEVGGQATNQERTNQTKPNQTEVGGASTNEAFTWSLLGILLAVMAWWY